MKKVLSRVILGSIIISGALCADSKVSKSIQVNSIPVSVKSNINKNLLQNIQRQALTNIGKSLNINTAVFNSKNDFSVYVELASTSKVGIKYKF